MSKELKKDADLEEMIGGILDKHLEGSGHCLVLTDLYNNLLTVTWKAACKWQQNKDIEICRKLAKETDVKPWSDAYSYAGNVISDPEEKE